METQQKLEPLDKFVKRFATKTAAADALDVRWSKLHRWVTRQAYADTSSRKLAALKGVELPVRPR